MGIRGPGAKVIHLPRGDTRQAEMFAAPPEAPPCWEAPGLTRAERVIAFCETLEVTAGKLAGTPFVVRPWQRQIITDIYAETPDGRRPVRTAVLSMGRKNGKTGLAAALALCHLAGPEAESRGEVYSAANDRAQAAKLFNEMVAMIRRHPFLNARISERSHSKELTDHKTGSIYVALSADASTKHGLSPSFVIYDELGQASGRNLLDALDTAMGARDDPLLLVISTQAATATAPMSELIDYGVRVDAGVHEDPSFRLFFFSAPDDADPWIEETWRLANPALGDFLSFEEVKRQAEQARRMPAKEPAFRNLILNQRVAAERQFLTASEWMANAEPPDLANLEGRRCYGGLDLSAVRDLTSFVLVFPDDEGRMDVVPWFWLPGDVLREREDDDKVPYLAWKLAGHLDTTPGATIDPAFIAAKVAEAALRFDLRMIGYDRWRIDDFKRALADIGADIPLSPFGQGYREMGAAVDVLERCVADRRLRHGANPILTMCASNAIATADPAGNRKLDKARSRGRIDGLVALTMALSVAAKHSGEEDAGGLLWSV